LERFANRNRRGAPPVARILFRPTGLRAGEIGVLFGARGENRSMFVENERAGSTGSDIDAEDWNTASI